MADDAEGARDFEGLGVFYLGRVFDPDRGETLPEPLLYESRDLTTHAVCVGMTGSGKTGLCVTLLEEAALDGIPALVVDPKGDLAGLLLAFPELRGEDFLPWIDPAEATRAGETPERHAEQVAERWRRGLAEWGQDGERIRRYRDAVDAVVYTPGSNAGRPLRVLGSLAAPSAALVADGDALGERVQSVVAGLLGLVGVEADPVQSREHILLSLLVERAWREGRDLELGALVGAIQSPPLERVGVMELESFFPARERFALAMRINNLLASPSFEAWLTGEPLDVGRLLAAPDGRPRLAVLSIAHLSERERMFFVTLLLGELISWMRAQPGTASLRALLFMDEIFGYFPPSAEPPSKRPMLTLLKQARAFGVGVVLATQNPVDLDYKGLANAGTWFLGRLQTERDKARVLDGIEAAAAAGGAAPDRARLDRLLSRLPSRTFVLSNAYDDQPVLFQTRWALSYLSGPLTRPQIQRLCGTGTAGAVPAPPRVAAGAAAAPGAAAGGARPVLPPEVPESFVAVAAPAPAGARLEYRPALLGVAQVHYADRRAGVDNWERVQVLAALDEANAESPWEDARAPASAPALEAAPREGAGFAALPAPASRARSYAAWGRQLRDWLVRERPLVLFRCASLSLTSQPGESEGAFRAGLLHAAREQRDRELEAARQRYAPRLAQLAERLQRAEGRVERERDQERQQSLQAAVSLGATVLGALFGRRLGSARNLGRATTAARGAGRVAREHADVARAQAGADDARARLAELEREFAETRTSLSAPPDPASLDVESFPVRAARGDLGVEDVRLVWTPFWVTPGGAAPAG